jgi:hypothetical protein
MKPASFFSAITSEGGLLPADFLAELLAPKSAIEGLESTSYNLAESERISEQVNRSWNRLKGRWADFKKTISDKQPGESTTSETRDRWLQPLFQELGFGQRLPLAKPIEVDGKPYPVSHGWNHVPIHLVGSHIDLDRRTPGAVGAAKASPHSLVQQVLNASDEHVWGIVSNGLTFRLLRDSIALTRLSYVEWDLAAIFDGDLYSEFFILWLVAHQSRFEGERADQCWLEKWKKIAEDKGLRALENLRPGVARAIEALGAGLVSHPANNDLRLKLSRGELSTQDFYRQVLRVIYRMLFLFVAEERDLLHQPLPGSNASKEEIESAVRTRRRYRDFYSITRLRGLTLYRAGTPHPDLWNIFQLLTQKLGSDTGCPELALPALGSFLWDAARSTQDLTEALVSNRNFLTAVHALAFVQDGSVRRPVDYKNLGSEELGSVYEGLLELHPLINADTGAFELNTAAGNERKTSGSYYTPDSLVQCLLDSALEPVISEAVRGKQGQDAVDALLKLKICDPAVGSGHFLIAAAHRLAKHVAAARSGEDEPSPEATRTALRDIIGRCLYGVDINPMSAELCRVSLWLEALEPGKPLSFLDHHIRVGNSLLGTKPELISQGIPDDAFSAIEGDDKKACAALKKLNARERAGFGELFLEEDNAIRDRLRLAATAIDDIGDNRPEDIHRKEAAFSAGQQNDDFQRAKDLSDLWCAAFVIKKHFLTSASEISDLQSEVTSSLYSQPSTTQTGLFAGTEEGTKPPAKKAKAQSRASSDIPIGITTQHLRDFVESRALPDGLLAEAKRLADQYQFFHFHLAFPEVFAQRGFDVSLGNPPWERTAFEDTQFFETRKPEILTATTTAARKKAIERLSTTEPILFEEYQQARRASSAESSFYSHSNKYPFGASGRLNTYALFTDLSMSATNDKGRAGLIVQTNLVTDAPLESFWRYLVESRRLISVLDFENKEGLFPPVHREQKFCLVTIAGSSQRPNSPIKVAFWLTNISQLSDASRVYELPRTTLNKLSPNTSHPLLSRTKLDLELALALYSDGEILCPLNNPMPRAKAWRALMTAGSSQHFRMHADFIDPVFGADGSVLDEETIYLPLIEAKLIGQFDHSFATYAGVSLEDIKAGEPRQMKTEERTCTHRSVPRFWVSQQVVEQMFQAKEWHLDWIVGYRDVTNVNNERTAIAAVTPRSGIVQPLNAVSVQSAYDAALVVGALNSFALDYVARQRFTGRHLNVTTFSQLPLPKRVPVAMAEIVASRFLELTYTAWDLQPFAQDCGWPRPPFRWDEERRFLLRCEMDAAFFHLYLGPEDEWRKQSDALTKAFPTTRDAVSYIMDTFPIVKRKEEAKFNGDYRTKRVILEIYDTMADAMLSGVRYETRLDPSPADPTCCHPRKKLGILAFGSLIDDPGEEIRSKIIMRIKTTTPFPVEFGRYSGKTRGGAPTLVKHETGEPVAAEILVLDESLPLDEARDMLWRRETRKIGSGEKYLEGISKNSVQVETTESPCVASILYTDFGPEGKIEQPTAAELATYAIESVKNAQAGMDGITYLVKAMAAGIKTPLTQEYFKEILRQSETNSLREALEKLTSI